MTTMSKKKWVLMLGALGFTGFGLCKIYQLPSVVEKRQRLFKLVDALLSLAEMLRVSAETIGFLSKDLNQFLQSDSDQTPRSLRQISKIIQSNEFSDSFTRITRALSVGILSGYKLESSKNGCFLGSDSDFFERITDKLFSSAGSGFASVVVGSFARNLVMACFSSWQETRMSKFDPSWQSDKTVPIWIEAICDDHKCKELIGDCVQLFVSTAVTVYLNKTSKINTFEELFAGLTNPKHDEKVKEMMASMCSNAVQTFIKTSHQVLTTDHQADVSKPSFDHCPEIGFNGSFLEGEKVVVRRKAPQARKLIKAQNGGLVSKMSSALAVPRNRKFVVESTGVVLFETVRSFLEFTVEKVSEPLKRRLDAVEEEVIDRGFRTMRYMHGKSCEVSEECVNLCLYILNSPWILASY